MDEQPLVGPRGLRLRASIPRTRRERLQGLLGRKRLEPGEAMLFVGARSVHTFGMRFQLAVAHLSPELEVLRLRVVPPGRLALPVRGARHVLECAPESDLRAGDVLRSAQEASAPPQGRV